MLITSLENDRVKHYCKLKEKKYRDKTGLFLVEGMHLVLEAYKAGAVEELILEKDEVLPLDVPIVYVTNDIIHKITQVDTPSKVLAVCRKQKNTLSSANRILLLDGIQDPGNLGTIIRSAVAFAIDLIVLSDDTVDVYNPKVVRSTQGMLFHIPIVRENLLSFLPKLKEQEIPLYGTKVTHGMDVKLLKAEDNKKFALIMGNEGNGVREEILDLCDQFLYIAMSEEVESLNVAVATSILLYELRK